MGRIRTRKVIAALSMLAVATFGLSAGGPVLGQQPVGDGHADHDHSEHDHSTHDHGAAEPVTVGPNGGQLSSAGDFQFEVVYSPNDIHLFVYDARQQPVAVQGTSGEMLMRVKGVEQELKFPLGYGQMNNARGQAQEVLGNQVDVSRVRDGDMQITFVVQGLPNQTTPSVQFEQTFALTRQAVTVAQHANRSQPMNTSQTVTVTVAALTAADQAGVAKQRICPVMDTPLGDHGNPIKLMVGNEPLYVCCKGCIRKVQQNPQAYLAKARQPGGMSRSADGHAGHSH